MMKESPLAEIVLDQADPACRGGVTALDDLNLEAADGEFMVLVGLSGGGKPGKPGKPAALRSIAGLDEIAGGTGSIGQRMIAHLPPRDRDILMIAHDYALYPRMTVAENLAFGLKLRNTPRAEIRRRVTVAARMLGLEPYLSRPPATLSRGQRQRVAMGRTIVRQPQAFLTDEPLSSLDAKLRESMRAALGRLHERLAITTVYLTRDRAEAMTLPPLESPASLFVAGFLGYRLKPAHHLLAEQLDVRDVGWAVQVEVNRVGALAG